VAIPTLTWVSIDWDADKARVNAAKHRVTFEEAATLFADPLELTIPDPNHSIDEDRYVSVGTSAAGRLLVVGYMERGSKIRVIFARRATTREQHDYEEA
jgi:uncharacterized DUF497 family protein